MIPSSSQTLSPAVWGVPVVTSATDRALQFPSPALNQRVYDLSAMAVERWNGSQWVVDPVISAVTQALVYGASVAIDATQGNDFTLTVTDGNPFTITSPTGALQGQRLTLMLRNASGGALGVATFGAAFRMSAWTNPANGFSRSITWRCDAQGNFIELSRTPNDVAN